MKFKIIFCFLNSKGQIESDEFGEIYYSKVMESKNLKSVINDFKNLIEFKEVKPEIIDIKKIGGTENE